MRYMIIIILAALILPSCSSGQFDIGKIGKDIDNVVNGNGLSNQEIINGLKEALNIGSKNASSFASKVDGYYKNPLIKIPFPPEAVKMQNTLKSMGMEKQVDEFILTINRAAEEAAKNAAPIFLNAITGMTISDGLSILKGKDTAATNYLRQKTMTGLHDKFKPVIRSATQKVNVTKYWNPLFTTYNKVPFVDKINPDLEEYITERALQGLFKLVAQEEVKIRKDPKARVTDLLKKVFGNNGK